VALPGDNRLIFSTQRHHQVAGVTQQELFALGIEAKPSRPYHPQTCGKVERFHQTMKKFLAMQDITSPSNSKDSWIVSSPTTTRCVRTGASDARHQHRCTTYGGDKAVPAPSFVKVGTRRLRFDRVDKAGRITLRHRARLHHIGIGNAYAGWHRHAR
jgi:transposase InsO family protein